MSLELDIEVDLICRYDIRSKLEDIDYRSQKIVRQINLFIQSMEYITDTSITCITIKSSIFYTN